MKPIHKKVLLAEGSNYRSMSLLPLISKENEKVIHGRTNAFHESKNLIYNYENFSNSHFAAFALSFSPVFCIFLVNILLHTDLLTRLLTYRPHSSKKGSILKKNYSLPYI